jgi:hypothetical protein
MGKVDIPRVRIIPNPAGRRSGKTEIAMRGGTSDAAEFFSRTGLEDGRFIFGAPTRDQAKEIFWEHLKALCACLPQLREPSESELKIFLSTGAQLRVVGLDKPHRIEGGHVDGAVIDEVDECKPGVYESTIRPTLSTRGRPPGWIQFIGRPKGRKLLYRLYNQALECTDGSMSGHHWTSEGIVDEAELAHARATMDPQMYRQEYLADFINFEGRAYPEFAREKNCVRLEYDPREDLWFFFDFNKSPGVAAVGQEQTISRDVFAAGVIAELGERATCIIGEVYIPRDSTTEHVCRRLCQDWGHHDGRVKYHGDATGGAGGSAAIAGSDWDIVYRCLRDTFGSRAVPYHKQANPRQRVRANAMNARIQSADGTVRFFVDPVKAPRTVESFEATTLLEGGSGELHKPKDDTWTHLSDAIGYYVEDLFPIYDNTVTRVAV